MIHSQVKELARTQARRVGPFLCGQNPENHQVPNVWEPRLMP